jgi:hypothetical protein
MHALVIVHEQDLAQLRRVAVDDADPAGLSPHMFRPPHTFELSVFSTRHSKAVELMEEPKPTLRPNEILQRYSTVVLLGGEYAANSPEIVELIRELCR